MRWRAECWGASAKAKAKGAEVGGESIANHSGPTKNARCHHSRRVVSYAGGSLCIGGRRILHRSCVPTRGSPRPVGESLRCRGQTGNGGSFWVKPVCHGAWMEQVA